MPIAEHLADGERAVALDPCLKRLAGDVLHHEVGKPLPRVDRVDRDHMLVGHRRSRPGLAGETQPGRAKERQLGGEDLDRDDAGERRIRALQDNAHPPSADDLKDLIRTQGTHVPGVAGRIEEGEDRPPTIPVIGHGPSPPLVRGLAGRAGLGRRKIGLADQEKTQVTPQAIVAGQRLERIPALFTTIEMGGQQFLLVLPEPALDVPPQPVCFALTRSIHHRVLPYSRPVRCHSPSTSFDHLPDPGHDPALGHVHGADAHPESIGDDLRLLALDPGLPEGRPGGPPKLATDPFGGPPEELTLVFRLEQRGVRR